MVLMKFEQRKTGKKAWVTRTTTNKKNSVKWFMDYFKKKKHQQNICMDFEGGRPPNFSENNKKKQFLWLSSCWFMLVHHFCNSTRPFLFWGGFPPKNDNECCGSTTLHPQWGSPRTGSSQWPGPRSGRHMSGIRYLYILYICISWQRLSSYGTQAPHKWSIVITCYNSVYRGCNHSCPFIFGHL